MKESLESCTGGGERGGNSDSMFVSVWDSR